METATDTSAVPVPASQPSWVAAFEAQQPSVAEFEPRPTPKMARVDRESNPITTAHPRSSTVRTRAAAPRVERARDEPDREPIKVNWELLSTRCC